MQEPHKGKILEGGRKKKSTERCKTDYPTPKDPRGRRCSKNLGPTVRGGVEGGKGQQTAGELEGGKQQTKLVIKGKYSNFRGGGGVKVNKVTQQGKSKRDFGRESNRGGKGREGVVGRVRGEGKV